MTFVPLGDQAVLAYASSEAQALRWAAAVRAAAPEWLDDVVPAYASVGVFYDADRIRPADAIAWLRALRPGSVKTAEPAKTHTIPVCYELGPDLGNVAEQKSLAADAVIELHISAPYTVYAIGFVPGFPYLGYLPEAIAGVPRLNSPRLAVEPGSVGLTGRQTGIYPLARPGGWHIIGRTPLTIVDAADGFFPIRVGDAVQFTRIDAAEFRQLAGERLAG